jgi:hypothetical protein
VKFELWNPSETGHASIKFQFIIHSGNRTSSFEKNWHFSFPRPLRGIPSMILLGVAYTAAIFDGLLRGLDIGVIEPEEPRQEVDWNVTAELATEDPED